MSASRVRSPEGSADRLRRVADRLAEWVERGDASAAVVLGAHHGEVALRAALGRLAPDPDAPRVQDDTIFPIASLSKPITATAVMALVEDDGIERFAGRLDTDLAQNLIDAVVLERKAVDERFRNRLNRKQMIRIADLINLAIGGNQRDAEEPRIGFSQFRDIGSDFSAAVFAIFGMNFLERSEDWRDLGALTALCGSSFRLHLT